MDRGTNHRAGVGYGDLAVVDLTAAITLDPVLANGKTFILDSATGFTVTLPPVTQCKGFRARFVVGTQPTSGNHVVTEDGSHDTDVLRGGINELEVDTNDDGPSTTGATQVNFIASVAVVGDFVELFSDGANWYFHGQTKADGGTTIT